jgi:hypothetical protein
VEYGNEQAYVEREEGNILIAVVDIVHYRHSCFSRSVKS